MNLDRVCRNVANVIIVARSVANVAEGWFRVESRHRALLSAVNLQGLNRLCCLLTPFLALWRGLT